MTSTALRDVPRQAINHIGTLPVHPKLPGGATPREV